MAAFDYDKYKSGDKKKTPETTTKSSGTFDYDKYREKKEAAQFIKPSQSINPLQGTMDSVSKIAEKASVNKKPDRKQLIKEGAQKLVSGPEPSDRPGRDIPVIGTALRNLDDIQKVTKPAADLMGQFYTPGGGLTAINAGYGAIQQGLGRILPGIARGTGIGQKIARGAITETVLGAPLAAGNALSQNPGISGKEFVKQTAIGTGLGAVTGAAAPLLGRALSKLFQRSGIPEQQVQEVLALPSPKQRGNSNVAPMVGEPIVTPYTFGLPEGQTPPRRVDVTPQEPLGLPSPRIDPPTRGRVEQQVNPYRQQFETLIDRAKQLEADGKLTPGREDEDLRSLWSQMAGKDAPSLDELIDLAYKPRPNRINPNLANQARQTQFSREVAGAPLPVKSSSERYVQGPLANVDAPVTVPKGVTQPRYGVFGEAASPQTMPGRAPGVARQPEVLSAQSAPTRPRVDVTPTQPFPDPLPRPKAPFIAPQEQIRGFAQTLQESPKPPQGFKEKLKSAYTPITNEQTLAQANKRINKDAEEAASFVLGNSRFTAEKATVAQRLIDHYNSQGNFQRSVDIAQKVSEEATRAGQSIQALSMFNRLTPQGMLIHAQRIAKKTNESIPIGAKGVTVTPDMAASITGLAQGMQKMTGVKDLASDVVNILEKAKTGEKLTETESQALKRFVNESKQFVQETAKKPKPPKPPQQPKDKRVRDNIVSFLDAQEQAAKERLRAKGIRISSTPLDVWADYAIIGAAKMGRGAIKFADWSEQMVKDLGEEIRPNLHQLYERSKEAFEASTKKISQQTISKAEQLTEKVINSKQLAPQEADSLRSLAQKVSSLSGEEKRIAAQDLQAILQTLEKPGILKKVSSLQTIGQLLNPKTQVRNSVGNELFYRLERLNKVIATPIDVARSAITGGPRTVTFRTNNQGEYWKNWMRGLKAGWKGVNVNGLETQYDLGSPAFTGKYNPLTYLEKSLGAALKSFDTAAYMRAYNNTIGEMATLRAINEGKRGNKELLEKYIREADDNVMNIADQYGIYVTFQDNSVISKGLVALKRGLNFKQDFGIGDLVLKYPKTPGALLMRSLEYSPAGFIRSLAILARPIWKAEPNTAEMTQALARAIVGTGGLSGLGYFLLDKGIITGAASKDRDIRDLQKSAGQGQYQVNISALMRFVKNNFDPNQAKLKEGDFLYSYDWMQPISIASSMGANVRKNLNEGKDGLSGLVGTVYNSVEGGLGTLTEQSVLSGLKRAAEGSPGQTVTDKIMDIVSDIPASFVPTFANQIKQLTDNARRETYDPSKLNQSINRAQAKIPGLSEKLPQQYDTLGKPKETYQDNSVFNVMLNPGFSSRYELSPEAKFIVDLIAETGDETLAPRVPGKSVTIDGESVKLNGDMFSRYQQIQGEETRDRIAKINPNASIKSRVGRTEKALDKAGEKARDQMKKELKANR